MKAFLSHSSHDKHLVAPVYKYLGPSKAHFDEATFDPLSRSYDEIIASLRESSLFVVFVSKNSISSEWVQEEIASAVDKATVGKILPRAVVLLDDVDRNQLPTPLLSATAIKHADASLVARRILGLLQEIRANAEGEPFFFGREDDTKHIKSALLPEHGCSPSVVLLAGTDGIGKRTLISRALHDCFRFLPKNLRLVAVPRMAGPLDLYMRLTEESPLQQLVSEMEAMGNQNLDAQIKQLSRKIESISRNKDVILINAAERLIGEEGDFASWFGKLVDSLPDIGHPQLILLSQRQLAPRYREARTGLYTRAVHSINESDSRRLLTSLLGASGLTLPTSTASKIAQLTEGHPGQIVRAAKLALTDGGVSATLRIDELVDALSRGASEIVRFLALDEISLSLVHVFSEFGALTMLDVFDAISDDERARIAISKLVDYCVIEPIGEGKYRIAPFLEFPLRRTAENRSDHRFVVESRRRIADKLLKVTADDIVSVDTLDQTVIAWLRSDDALPPIPGAKLLLPASMLHAALAEYDAQQWPRAAELAKRAIAGEWTLTPDALAEAYRIRGLSLARLNEAEAFDRLISEISSNTKLADIGQKSVQKMVNFLQGFMARLDGRYEDALRHFVKYESLGGGNNFKALREHAHALYRLDRFDEAEKFARKAQEKAPKNPHVLALIADILLARSISDSDTANAELETVIAELEKTDDLGGTSFSIPRIAKMHLISGKPELALAVLQNAAGHGVDPNYLGLDIAEAHIKNGKPERALTQIESTITKAKRSLKQRILTIKPIAARLKIEALCSLGRVDEARDLLANEKRIFSEVARRKAEKQLAFALAAKRGS